MKRSIPNYRPKGHWLAQFVAHCRVHTLLTTDDVQAITGFSRERARNLVTHQVTDGWFERVAPGVVKMTPKADAWGAPVSTRIIALCNEARRTAQDISALLGISLECARSWLGRLSRQGLIHRISRNLFGRRLQLAMYEQEALLAAAE